MGVGPKLPNLLCPVILSLQSKRAVSLPPALLLLASLQPLRPLPGLMALEALGCPS